MLFSKYIFFLDKYCVKKKKLKGLAASPLNESFICPSHVLLFLPVILLLFPHALIFPSLSIPRMDGNISWEQLLSWVTLPGYLTFLCLSFLDL